uniref:LiaF domain-containing protein n=1 Tax=Actinotalea sp. C106 TaxID=2908644 RepID=UPI0020280716
PPPGPRTPLPRTGPRGPGAGAVGAVVALGLIGLAVLMYAERVGEFTGPVLLTAGAGTVVLAGLAIIISGLRGRTSGSLGALAVLGILVLLPLSAVERSSWTWNSSSTAFGDLVHTPRTVAEAEAGYSLGAGEARIDLTELPSSRDPIEVTVDVGAGQVTVVVPEGGDVLGEVQVFAGEVDWLGQSTTRVGGGTTSTYESDSVAEGAEAELVLEISVGAGSVRVIEG